MGTRIEQRQVKPVAGLDMFGSEDGLAGSHPPHQGQTLFFSQKKAAGFQQPDAPGRAGQKLDHPLALQSPQVFFRCIRGPKTQLPGHFCPGGRHSSNFYKSLNKFKNFCLPGSEVSSNGRGHGLLSCISVQHWDCIQIPEVRKPVFPLLWSGVTLLPPHECSASAPDRSASRRSTPLAGNCSGRLKPKDEEIKDELPE